MSRDLFEAIGKRADQDASEYVRIYDQATGRAKSNKPVQTVHIYAGRYGLTAAHQANRGEPKWAKLFAVLDLIEPVIEPSAHQRQWIMHVDEFKELASLDKESDHG